MILSQIKIVCTFFHLQVALSYLLAVAIAKPSLISLESPLALHTVSSPLAYSSPVLGSSVPLSYSSPVLSSSVPLSYSLSSSPWISSGHSLDASPWISSGHSLDASPWVSPSNSLSLSPWSGSVVRSVPLSSSWSSGIVRSVPHPWSSSVWPAYY